MDFPGGGAALAYRRAMNEVVQQVSGNPHPGPARCSAGIGVADQAVLDPFRQRRKSFKIPALTPPLKGNRYLAYHPLGGASLGAELWRRADLQMDVPAADQMGVGLAVGQLLDRYQIALHHNLALFLAIDLIH